MSGTVVGTIAPTGVSGNVAPSLSGPISGPGGCSNGIIPATIARGACTAANNSIISSNFTVPPTVGYNVSGILTRP